MNSPARYEMRLCSEKTGFEIRLDRRSRIDLPSLAERVARAVGMQVRVALPSILILQGAGDSAVTVFPDGRILLRGMSEESAESVADILVPLLVGDDNR